MILTGNDASLSIGSHAAKYFSYNLAIHTRIYQTSSFGDNWEKSRSGAKLLTGSATGRLYGGGNPGSTTFDDTENGVSAVFTFATGDTISCNIHISDVVMVADRYNTQNASVSFNFVSTDTVTQAWA